MLPGGFADVGDGGRAVDGGFRLFELFVRRDGRVAFFAGHEIHLLCRVDFIWYCSKTKK